MKQTDDIKSKLMEAVLLERKAGDQLVLDDHVLKGAIQGERPLTKSQAAQLANSPLTLMRFKHLVVEHEQAVSGWNGSSGILLAAAGEDKELDAIDSEDKMWSLYFLPGQAGLLEVTLKLHGNEKLLDELIESERAVEVVDAEKRVLCSGQLDDSGELTAPWKLEERPRQHFMRIGGRFVVRPVTLT